MAYEIRSHRGFSKDIHKIPKKHQQKVYRTVTSLSTNPRNLPPNTAPIKGVGSVYRIRFGKFRLILRVNHREKYVHILGIGPRSGVYKIMNRLLS